MSEVRAFHVPGSSALALVRQRTRAALAAWARDWVSGAMDDEQRLATLQVESAGAADLHPLKEFEGLPGASGRVWIRRGVQDRMNCAGAVFGGELMQRAACIGDWIADISDSAWAARNRAVCEALVGSTGTETPAANGSGSPAGVWKTGAGLVKVSCESFGLYAIADGGVWTRVPPAELKAARLPALVPLDCATLRAHLCIDVMLGSAELELPRLMDLRRGDLLRLPSRLDQPLTVSCQGMPFARALLGGTAGRKCIQLTDRYQ